MAYTYLTLKTKLAGQISDPNVDSTITGDALIDTEQEIFNKYDLTLNSGVATLSVAQGTNTLTPAMPADFQRIRNLNILNPEGLARSIKDFYLPPDEFDIRFSAFDQTMQGPLQDWTYYDGEGILFGTMANDNYTLRLRYTKSVPILANDADVPTVPEAFRELLMLGAKIRIYENKEDFDFAQQFQNRYADLLQDFVTRYGNRQVDINANVAGSRFRPVRR